MSDDQIKERILCAAIMRKEPKVDKQTNYKKEVCWEQYGKYDDIYKIEVGRRHNDIIQRFKDELDATNQGFYTSFGRFVSREEALSIALKAKQVRTELIYFKQLYSEDLY